MKHWGTRKTIGIASASVALMLAGTVVWLLNKPPTADCAAEAAADHQVHEIRATRVVAQPWLGEHQVYGIFMVPKRYRHNKEYVITMTVGSFDRYFTVGEPSANSTLDEAFAEPAHYRLRSYVPTRVALWF